MAVRNGALDAQRLVNPRTLSKLVLQRLSHRYLHSLGLLDATGTPGWTALMVRPGTDVPFVPVKHVILEASLTGAADVGSLNFRSSGPPATTATAADRFYADAATRTLAMVAREGRKISTDEFV